MRFTPSDGDDLYDGLLGRHLWLTAVLLTQMVSRRDKTLEAYPTKEKQ